MTITVQRGETASVGDPQRRVSSFVVSNPAVCPGILNDGVLTLYPEVEGTTTLTVSYQDGEETSEPLVVAPPALPPAPTNLAGIASRTTIQFGFNTESSQVVNAVRVRIREGTTADAAPYTWLRELFLAPFIQSHLFIALNEDTDHVVEATAISSLGEGGAATVQVRTLAPPQPPLTPIASAASAAGGFRVNFRIGLGSDPVTGWEVEWKRPASRRWLMSPLLAGSSSSYIVESADAAAGGDFDWRVRGIGQAGSGAWFTGRVTLPTQLPGKVPSLAVTFTAATRTAEERTVATWGTPAGEVSVYELQCSDDEAINRTRRTGRYLGRMLMEIEAGTNSVRLPGSFSNRTHGKAFRIRAVNGAGAGPWSDTVGFAQSSVPRAPVLALHQQHLQQTELSIGAWGVRGQIWERGTIDYMVDQGAVRVTNYDEPSGLRIWVRRTGQPWGTAIDLGNVWFETSPVTVLNEASGARMVAGGSYQVRAQAYNNRGSSAFSNTQNVTLLAAGTPSAVPGKPIARVNAGGLLFIPQDGPRFRWDMPDLAVPASSWRIAYRNTAADSWTERLIEDAHTFQWDWEGRPNPWAPLQFRVQGINARGAGAWSDIFNWNQNSESRTDTLMRTTGTPWVLPGDASAVVPANRRVQYSWEPNLLFPSYLQRFLFIWPASGTQRWFDRQAGIGALLQDVSSGWFTDEEARALAWTDNRQREGPRTYWWCLGWGYQNFYQASGRTRLSETLRTAMLYKLRRYVVPTSAVPGAPTATIVTPRGGGTGGYITVMASADTDAITNWQEITVSGVRTYDDQIIASSSGGSGNSRRVNFRADMPLVTGNTYYWRARAQNVNGLGPYGSGSFVAN